MYFNPFIDEITQLHTYKLSICMYACYVGSNEYLQESTKRRIVQI